MFQLLIPLLTSMMGGAAGGGLSALLGGAAAGGLAAGAGAAGAAAAGAAAAPAAASGIGALFGKAFLPALGSGIGTLLTGGSGADAIRNAALAGTGSALLGGPMSKLMGSTAGKALKAGSSVAGAAGGGQRPQPVSAPMTSSPRPQPRPMDLGQNQPVSFGPQKGIMSPMNYAPPSGGPPPGVMSPMAYNAPPPAPPTNRRGDAGNMGGIMSVAPMPYNPLEGLSPSMGSPIAPTSSFPVPPVSPTSGISPLSIDLMSAGNANYPELFSTSPNKYRDALDIITKTTGGYGPGKIDPSIMSAAPYMDAFTKKLYADKLMRNLAASQSAMNSLLPGPRVGRHAQGGAINGPGTGTSDSVPAQIYQGGEPVQRAKLSDGEFVMTAKAVRNAGGGDRGRGINRMYELMRRFENGELA